MAVRVSALAGPKLVWCGRIGGVGAPNLLLDLVYEQRPHAAVRAAFQQLRSHGKPYNEEFPVSLVTFCA